MEDVNLPVASIDWLLVNLQGWQLPKEFSAIHRFLEKISSRQSWKNTLYTDKYVEDGWKLKVKLLTEG